MKYSNIKLNDVANGKGVVLSLWTQGCPHKCAGCFNKETWSYDKGKKFTEEDAKYILNNLDADGVVRGFSILGGEPLCPENIKGVIEICKRVREKYPNKNIFIWTGYLYEDLSSLQREVLKYINILVDGRFIEAKRNITLKWRGSENQRVIDVKKSLELNDIVICK